ncbi:polysaccharide deacetylase family protein [bacterium]|nr:polysaccharide deacetylase family protein [bacterium]MBU3956102.1 polysaccharide deacetylase family protein [bacterium]
MDKALKFCRKQRRRMFFFLLLLAPFAFGGQKVALTFDDGPHPYYTKKILEILNEYSVKGTFFLVGKQAEKYPELVTAIKGAGCEIGNHTYNHPRLIYLSESDVQKEVKSTTLLLENITGEKIKYFRPPGGRYYFNTLENISGLEIILWTINTDDIFLSSEKIYEEVITAEEGDIILMHSGVPQTVKALPRILRYFSKNGITALSVSELRKRKSAELFE